MLKSRKWLIAGAAVATLIGTAALAQAKNSNLHEINVQLPGGGVEHITYTGSVRPTVVVLPNAKWVDPFAVSFAAPVMSNWPGPAFAELDRISAQMNRQMNAMLEQTQALQSAARSGVLSASFKNAPPGTVEYSQVTTWTRNGACTKTVRMTEPANGAKPQLVSDTSGDCSGTAASSNASGLTPAHAIAHSHGVAGSRI